MLSPYVFWQSWMLGYPSEEPRRRRLALEKNAPRWIPLGLAATTATKEEAKEPGMLCSRCVSLRRRIFPVSVREMRGCSMSALLNPTMKRPEGKNKQSWRLIWWFDGSLLGGWLLIWICYGRWLGFLDGNCSRSSAVGELIPLWLRLRRYTGEESWMLW